MTYLPPTYIYREVEDSVTEIVWDEGDFEVGISIPDDKTLPVRIYFIDISVKPDIYEECDYSREKLEEFLGRIQKT